jgi:vancomycin resistance protein YoaR
MGKNKAVRRAPDSIVLPVFQVGLVLAAGIALFFLLLVGVVVGFDVYHQGVIYPGVAVGGVDVAGLTAQQASDLLAKQADYPQSGKVVFQDGARVWVAHPVEVGLFFDARATGLAAYNLGRHGSIFTRMADQFDAWFFGKDLPPLYVYDEQSARTYLEKIAAQVDQPTIEASLSLKGKEVVAQPGQIGRHVDVTATLAPLQEQMQNLRDGILPITIAEVPPVILDVSQQADAARKILSAPLKLTLPGAAKGDPGPWTFDPQKLSELLVIERATGEHGAEYQIHLREDKLRAFLGDLAPRLARKSDNARFIFNDDTHQLEPISSAVTGRRLDVDASIQTINQKLLQGQHEIPLEVQISQPEIGDSVTADQLGIHELVGVQATYFYGSSAARIQNIQTAAARFHGLLVPPGAVFSMGDILGDVSLDNGYAEALIIYGNRTIKGVGGGVCQVSTTLFRTAFFAGYPIVERVPHAYRVYYYELNAADQVNNDMAGLDATVFVPLVDFKFKNDTSNWLLMETYVNAPARKLTWKFYSTSDGRTVDWQTSGLQNIVDPPDPLYQENSDLAPGEINQVDWGVAGADVSVQRTVYRDGQVYLQDTFNTHYQPWQDVFDYGPGTDIPTGGKKQRGNH